MWLWLFKFTSTTCLAFNLHYWARRVSFRIQTRPKTVTFLNWYRVNSSFVKKRGETKIHSVRIWESPRVYFKLKLIFTLKEVIFRTEKIAARSNCKNVKSVYFCNFSSSVPISWFPLSCVAYQKAHHFSTLSSVLLRWVCHTKAILELLSARTGAAIMGNRRFCSRSTRIQTVFLIGFQWHILYWGAMYLLRELVCARRWSLPDYFLTLSCWLLHSIAAILLIRHEERER